MHYSKESHSSLVQAIKQAAPHDHLCLIYETLQEQLAAAVSFIRIGLERGEQCVYIVDENVAATVIDAMHQEGINVDAAIQSGALTIADKQVYLNKGYFDPDGMIAFLKGAVEAAERAGYTALRITGEMTWALGGDPGAERLMEYEAKLNRFFPSNNVVAICQYNRNRFQPELIQDVIRTHPKVISGGLVCQNQYYIPPDEFLTDRGAAQEVERLIRHIVERERDAVALSEGKAALALKKRQLEEETAERRRADARLHLYQRIIASASDAIAIIDAKGYYLEQNYAHRMLIGYSDEALQGKTPQIHLGEEPFRRIAEQLQKSGSYQGEHVSRTKSGKKIEIELTAFSMKDDAGDVVCHVGVKRDITERKRIERALRRSEQTLADFFENAAVGLHWIGPDGMILRANRAELDLLGYQREEYVGRHISEFHADVEVANDLLQRLSQGETLRHYEARFRCKDGSIKHLLIDSNVFWEDGKFVHVRCFTRDITEQRKGENRLRRQNRVLGRLARSRLSEGVDLKASFGEITRAAAHVLEVERASVWLYDDARSKIRCFDLYERSLSRHSEGMELPAERYPAYFEALELERIIPAHDAHADPRTEEFSESYLAPLGITSMLDAPIWLNGKMVGVVCHEQVGPARRWTSEEQHFSASIADVTALALETWERKQAEAALQKAHDALAGGMEQLRRQLDISQALHHFSSRFALGEKSDLFLTEVVRRIAELTKATRCGISLIDSNRKTIRPHAFYGFEEGVMQRLEAPLIEEEGDPIYRLLYRGEMLRLHPIWSDPGMERYRPFIERLGIESILAVPLQIRGIPLGVLWICDKEQQEPFTSEDIQLMQTIANQIALAIANQQYAGHLEQINEELQRKKIEAEEASRLKSHFLSNISHELRTPLNAIIGYTHLLMEEVYGTVREEQRLALRGVRRNAHDLTQLVNDVLDLAKIEAGKMSVTPSKVDLAVLIDEVVSGIYPLSEEKGLPISCGIASGLPSIESDVGKIKQILVNLLSNAVKFTSNGEITIRARMQADGTGVEIAVQDTGIGIRPEHLPRIFDTFHQVDGAATREFGGVGLGLAIVKELLSLLEGGIRVESDPGKGSTFTFTLPIRLSRK
ncbi:MAG: MEDS domain-containing protein [Nitrospirae bacterium]|nr:MEDS domain-containing protein [Candidatus Manganitrophaceae bacterium]